MTDPIREAAIEAAAKKQYVRKTGGSWATLADGFKRMYRDEVTPLVDAVLAVAGPAYRAEGWDEHHRDVCTDCAVDTYANPY